MTAAQEKRIKEFNKAQRARRYVFTRAGMDLRHPYAHTPIDGTIVVKTQPHGCPRNGRFGQCYVADTNGQFIGMVDQRSLNVQKKQK